ncbi:hypothetical protein BSL78_09693 [Apostichopus japonicus]|uniref:HAT C-terminal dimerisation domain-containing protein n=1 Tax=Stichopus japonicus TaxID=307972 RepID=A0A2G8KZS2_STIJA|nr:hypothetical protein BSL78_09693 [Apostichopus japonicus]
MNYYLSDSNDMHKDYGDEGGLSHIIYMYIFCFGIISALLVIIMMIRCLLKLKKKAKAQFTKIECERRPSSMSAQDVLFKLNLFTDAYKSIGLAYKLLVTLPVSQVACEHSFSALKRIKNRLRSTMTQEHIEAFMLMSVEKKDLGQT